MDQQDGRPRACDAEGPAITMDGAVLKGGRDFANRMQIAFSCGHGANFNVGAAWPHTVVQLWSSLSPLRDCWARKRSNAAPNSSPLGNSSSRVSSDRFS